jgi:glutathionyl-hydroquinone reductase
MTSKAAARTALDELSADGAFKRVDAAWRNWISKGEH